MVAGCTCHGARPRCAWCVENTYRQLAGVAQARGDAWACGIAYACGSLLERPWPDDDNEKMRAIASRKVADLADPHCDPDLHELLLEQAIQGARRRWEQLRREPERARQLKPSKRNRPIRDVAQVFPTTPIDGHRGSLSDGHRRDDVAAASGHQKPTRHETARW
jgi:hypothetical protein